MTSIISTSRNGDFKVISKRIPMLDYARLLTAFLVIYGHLFPYEPNNYVRVFIYQFHMPLFFVISGMLHKYNGSVQNGISMSERYWYLSYSLLFCSLLSLACYTPIAMEITKNLS